MRVRELMFAAILVLCAMSNGQAQDRVPTSKTEMQLSFAPLVEATAPSVVNVYATKTVQSRSRSPFFDDPFFQRFFGGNGFGAPSKRIERSLGSGVIVAESGVVVTNHHVIAGATEVRVALANRQEFDAKVILTDEKTDLAILKINEKRKFPALTFANSDDLKVGDLVLAIGNPFGVGQTVTSGIVSALARTQVGISDYQFFIQTDAAINPGNSGGALVNMRGELVGVNTAIFSRSGGSNGIGFAIPANMVRLVAEGAISGKGVQRAWLGAQLQAVTSDIAEGLGLERPQGVLVTDVVEKGPAAAAGLKVGDLILNVGRHPVDSPDGFGYRLATIGLGKSVDLTLIRRGKQIRLTLQATVAPETVPRDQRRIEGYSPFSGTNVLNLSPAVAQELGLPTDLTGVVIFKVVPGSRAARFGVRRGDIVREINGEAITSTKVLEILSKQDFRIWRLKIERDGQLIRTAISG
ncbi:DegQ family serine endoprotease [Cohaesibacter gelatinilyticus]|uniref:Do/DeqQ family serine protease n=1 Tax=Cohaesibacter gelatinilyticus TaxID=372072 RepID=A0A285NFP3_9HYPH|nr:DegQ family serine endoprotease [Cohaesibacter gelatinilyticus]SNZ08332.1 Do/DeqQ family serine protease [Cohaesibacter gelatinilyticus]